jgi:hypothetical protein
MRNRSVLPYGFGGHVAPSCCMPGQPLSWTTRAARRGVIFYRGVGLPQCDGLSTVMLTAFVDATAFSVKHRATRPSSVPSAAK